MICPDEKLEIGRIEHDPKIIKMTYDLGRQVAERRLDDIRRFIENGN